MEDENSNVSQNAGDSEEVQYEEMGDIRELFGLPDKVETKAEEDSGEGEQSVKDETPAIEDVKTESKKRVVKFNKEDREIDESEVDELIQKGLALDKQRERTTDYEKALERAAKLAGFNTHDELLANLDQMEQRQVKAKEDEFQKARQEVIEQLVLNGVDEQEAIRYAENNPLVQQARQAMEERQQLEVERQRQSVRVKEQTEWSQLYEAFPEIREDSQAFGRGETPSFFTSEMQSMVDRGYSPKDAYVLAHGDKIQTQTKKQIEQKAIKDMQLGNRSQVETIDKGSQEKQVSEELRGAFAMFGIDPKRAQKYAK